MACGVPILGENDRVHFGHESIDPGNDLISACHSERAARAEIILDIDND